MIFGQYTILCDLVTKILNFTWHKAKDCYRFTLVADDGQEMKHYEYEEIPINDIEVETDFGETYTCDAVLLFGDGTIEFHSKDDMDAFYWEDHTEESVERIIAELQMVLEPR